MVKSNAVLSTMKVRVKACQPSDWHSRCRVEGTAKGVATVHAVSSTTSTAQTQRTSAIDLETVDALCLAVNTFAGGVVVVSHDQHLLSSVCTEYWAISEQKVVTFKEFNDAKRFCYGKLKLPGR